MAATESATAMTEEQLREHLYHDLQTSGVLDSMKSQLRQRLARELRRNVKSFPVCNSSGSKTTLGNRISASLVAEFLKTAGFEYSLSVFLPEADIRPDKLYCMTDLVQYLRVDPSSVLYSKLVPAAQDQSLLDQLLNALVYYSAHTQQQETSSTTTNHTTPKKADTMTVAEQLHALDQSYAKKAEEENAKTQQNIEERLLCYQRDLETQHKHQLHTELALYKSREVAKVKTEERERYQQELAGERLQATVAHQKQIQELKKMEQQMMERYRKKEQDLEAGMHNQRQSLLTQLSALKLSESELQRQSEYNKRATQLEEQRLTKLEQQLTGREKAMENIKAQYETIAEQKAKKNKLEMEIELQCKWTELSHWEAKLQREQDKISTLQTELQTEREKADRLQSLLHEATAKHLTLQGHKDALQQRVDKMNDYDQLQKKSQELAQELANAEIKLSNYKHRNSDSQRLIHELQSNVLRPVRELEAVQKELDDIRRARQKELVGMETNNRGVRRQLAVQTRHSEALQKKLDDQMVGLLSAQREVQEVHSLLEQLNSTGAKTNIKRMPSRSVPPTSMPYQPSAALSARSNQEPHTVVASSQLLEESRATIARLEEEAQELEATCLNLTSPLVPPDTNLLATLSLHHPYAVSTPLPAWPPQVQVPTTTTVTIRPLPPTTLSQPSLGVHPSPIYTTPANTVSVPPPSSSTVSVPPPSSSTVSVPAPNSSTVTVPAPNSSTVTVPAPNSSTVSVFPTSTVPSSTVTVPAPLTVSRAVVPLPTTTAPRVTAPPPPPTTTARVSLDELWKPSQDKSQSTSSTKATLVSPQANAEHVEEEEAVSHTVPSTEQEKLQGMQPESPTHFHSDPATVQGMQPESPTHSHSDPATVQGIQPESPTHSHSDEIDSVMLKYMELVKQNRNNAAATDQVALVDQGELDEFGILPLSHQTESYSGFSDKDEDPFDDW